MPATAADIFNLHAMDALDAANPPAPQVTPRWSPPEMRPHEHLDACPSDAVRERVRRGLGVPSKPSIRAELGRRAGGYLERIRGRTLKDLRQAACETFRFACPGDLAYAVLRTWAGRDFEDRTVLEALSWAWSTVLEDRQLGEHLAEDPSPGAAGPVGSPPPPAGGTDAGPEKRDPLDKLRSLRPSKDCPPASSPAPPPAEPAPQPDAAAERPPKPRPATDPASPADDPEPLTFLATLRQPAEHEADRPGASPPASAPLPQEPERAQERASAPLPPPPEPEPAPRSAAAAAPPPEARATAGLRYARMPLALVEKLPAPVDRQILAVLAEELGPGGRTWCHATAAELARRCGVSRRTLTTHVEALKGAGWLRVIPQRSASGRQAPSRYELLPPPSTAAVDRAAWLRHWQAERAYLPLLHGLPAGFKPLERQLMGLLLFRSRRGTRPVTMSRATLARQLGYQRGHQAVLGALHQLKKHGLVRCLGPAGHGQVDPIVIGDLSGLCQKTQAAQAGAEPGCGGSGGPAADDTLDGAGLHPGAAEQGARTRGQGEETGGASVKKNATSVQDPSHDKTETTRNTNPEKKTGEQTPPLSEVSDHPDQAHAASTTHATSTTQDPSTAKALPGAPAWPQDEQDRQTRTAPPPRITTILENYHYKLELPDLRDAPAQAGLGRDTRNAWWGHPQLPQLLDLFTPAWDVTDVPTTYVHGEPGVGKTQAILGVLESEPPTDSNARSWQGVSYLDGSSLDRLLSGTTFLSKLTEDSPTIKSLDWLAEVARCSWRDAGNDVRQATISLLSTAERPLILDDAFRPTTSRGVLTALEQIVRGREQHLHGTIYVSNLTPEALKRQLKDFAGLARRLLDHKVVHVTTPPLNPTSRRG